MPLFQRVAAVFAILLPALASLGGGGLAYTMYARSVWFRLEIIGADAGGRRHAVAPSMLASKVGASAAPFFTGSDHFRRTYGVGALENHLPEVARLSCEADDRRPTAIDVTLVLRDGATGPERTHTEHATCAR